MSVTTVQGQQGPEKRTLDILNKKNNVYFYYKDSVEMWQQEYDSKISRKVKLLSIVDKVISVILALFSVAMPMAIFYLPAWAPWGIGLPSMILLAIIQSKVKGRLGAYERNRALVPFLKEFLHSYSPKALHPIGEWDLPKLDERLKSDLVMAHQLRKVLPESGRSVENVIGKYDLEMTPYVQQQVAYKFADKNDIEAKWKGIRSKIQEAAGHFRREAFTKYGKAQEQAVAAGYETLSGFDFPLPSAKSQVEAVIAMYEKRYKQLHDEVEALIQEGVKLYGRNPLKEWDKKESDDALIKINELKALGSPLAKMKYIEDNQLKFILFQLIDQAIQKKAVVNAWIAEHPQQQVKAIEKRIENIGKEDRLAEKDLKKFNKWINRNAWAHEKKCVELVESEGFPKEMKEWVLNHTEARNKKPFDVLQLCLKINKKAEKAEQKLTKLKTVLADTNQSEETFTKSEAKLSAFNKQILTPLNRYIVYGGETSTVKRWARAFFSRTPAVPFEKAKLPPKTDPILRMRKFQEIPLNKMLQQIDSKIVWTNRARQWGVRAPLYILLAIEGIFALYFATPWMFFGFCFFAVVSEGISHYVDYRLKQMDKKKQAIKLQHLLLDHPDICRIPGNRPKLKELKQLQATYGLEGIRPTWARALAEGESILEPQDAKKLCEEGSKKAEKFLRDRITVKYSRYENLVPNTQEWEALGSRLVEMDYELQRVPEKGKKYPEQALSDHEREILQENYVDAQLDLIAEKRFTLEKKKSEYEQQSSKFKQLQTKITDLKTKKPLIEGKLVLIAEAMKAKGVRDSQEKIEVVLEAIMNARENPEQLKKEFERLQKLSAEALFSHSYKLQRTLQRLLRLEYNLAKLKADPEYVSKENVDNKAKECAKALTELDAEQKKPSVVLEAYKVYGESQKAGSDEAMKDWLEENIESFAEELGRLDPRGQKQIYRIFPAAFRELVVNQLSG